MPVSSKPNDMDTYEKSGMTLDGAIRRGLLPETMYVSVLYGYDKQIEDMQERIDKIKDRKMREEAQNQLNTLRKKLSEDTYNLSDIFYAYMKNNGKYIVFCKNIEDMNEKIKQAKRMFGRVNSNITVRSISSKIKSSDRIVKEFEQDSDEGTLKLLYAVDKIDGKYHVQDLDGVVMMNPTLSQAIYTKQLGRAITIGRAKNTVVFDLVNNFEQYKIIKDFMERIKQHKGSKGVRKSRGNTRESRITFIDKIKEFSKIERKITELSSRKSIDEKIDNLIEWKRKYPEATVVPTISSEVLSKYAKTEENLKQLMEEYEKMVKNYTYVRVRKSRGKLSQQQIKKCVDGNIGGVFGRHIDPEDTTVSETNELMMKYGLSEKTINFIRKQYGSIDRFREIFIEAMINRNVNSVIPKELLEKTNLITEFDLSSSDWAPRDKKLVEIFNICIENLHKRTRCYKDNIFRRYGLIKEKIIEVLKGNRFTDQERKVLSLYGLSGENCLTQTQISRNIGKSTSRVGQLLSKAERKLAHPQSHGQLNLEQLICDIDIDLQQKIIKEYFQNFDIFVPKEPVSMNEDVKIKLTTMLEEGIEKTKKRDEQMKIILRMPNEQVQKIIRAKYGETINNSCSNILRECLDTEYAQGKIAEYIVNNYSNSELIKMDKKKIEESITNNGYFSEEEKNELKGVLRAKIKVATKEKILKGIETLNLLETVTKMKIDENLIKQMEEIERSDVLDDDEKKALMNELKQKYYKEISKEDLVEHILDQQRTIAKQYEELNELSSKKKEDIDFD